MSSRYDDDVQGAGWVVFAAIMLGLGGLLGLIHGITAVGKSDFFVANAHYVIAGTDTKEDAEALAARVHGEVEPGGELVYEVMPQNPFAIFGGLGG